MGPDQTTLRRGRLRGFLVPSLADCVFVSILGWLFFAGAGAASLLADGDTGWHIRTGEHILATGAFPHEDLFSFTMEGRQWFAWEWLSDEILSNVVDGAGQAARCSISSPSLNFFPSKTWTISSEPLSLRQRASA